MSILHMETDQVLQVTQQFLQTTDGIMQTSGLLENSARTLSASWQGGSSDEFTAELVVVMTRMREVTSAGEQLKQRLEREVHEWLEVDAVFGEMGANPLPYQDGGMLPVDGGQPGIVDNSEEDSSWLDFFKDFDLRKMLAADLALKGYAIVKLSDLGDQIWDLITDPKLVAAATTALLLGHEITMVIVENPEEVLHIAHVAAELLAHHVPIIVLMGPDGKPLGWQYFPDSYKYSDYPQSA